MTYSPRGRTTIYKGIRMRSRLEASFAASLDGRELAWTYEPQCFADQTGQYLPDFRVTNGADSCYCEVKPETADTGEALRKMHIIRSSEPSAILNVLVPTGTYPNQRWTVVGKCRSDGDCPFCALFSRPFRDLRMVPGADRTLSLTRRTP